MEEWLLLLKLQKQKNGRCAHTRRGRFLLAQEDSKALKVPMRCRLLSLSKLAPGSSASCGEARDTWWLTASPC